MKNDISRHYSTLVAAAAAVLTSTALTACSAPRVGAAPADAIEPIPVTAAPVTMTEVATAIESGGVVQARTTAVLAARIVAAVREVRVSPGDHVRKEQTLIHG